MTKQRVAAGHFFSPAEIERKARLLSRLIGEQTSAARDRMLLQLGRKRPHEVLIEPTNRCNLNCPFCMVGRQNALVAEHGNAAHSLMKRPMGKMSPETFARLRNQILDFGVRRAFLYFQGEPFLNVNTPEYAAQLKRDGLYVALFTNGQAFNDANRAAIVNAGVDLIRFSVDGASEETYQQNRRGGKLSVALENMQLLAAALRGKPTRIEWQFLALRNNEHEIEKARRMADEIGVQFFVKGYRETLPELAATDERYRARFLPKPCTDIYRHFGVYWNGDVVPCCYDNDASEVMGNLMESDLKHIWDSGKYREFRRRVDQVANHPEAEPELCRGCLRWR